MAEMRRERKDGNITGVYCILINEFRAIEQSLFLDSTRVFVNRTVLKGSDSFYKYDIKYFLAMVSIFSIVLCPFDVQLMYR